MAAAPFFLHPAMAAPLDALTTAKAPDEGKLQLEIAYDAVNNTLDVLKIRAKDPVYGGTAVGDYSGYHARADYGLTSRLSIAGELWQRKITNPGETAAIDSWNISGKYRFLGNNEPVGLALRVSAWGDSSGTLKKNSPTQVLGRTVQTVTVNSPSDRQLQADLIGTWTLSPRTEWSAFVGAGTSQVDVAGLSATTVRNGCPYNLTFTQTMVTVTQAISPCGGVSNVTATNPDSTLQEFSYRSTYYQAGTMLQWHHDGWQIRGGYLFRHLNRQNVDALLTSRGGIPYQTNHIVTIDVARRVTRNIAAFVRGQAMSNQFVGEIPFSYNSATANKFGRLYGYASFGVMLSL